MANSAGRNTLIIGGLFIVVSLTWGTTWMAMKLAVATIPPITATGLRFLSAAPLLLLLAHITRTPLLFPSRLRGFQCVVCLFYFAFPFTLMIYGERSVNSGLASIIFANMPVAVMAVSAVLLKARITRRQGIGLLLSVCSLSGILWLASTGKSVTNVSGVVALLGAMLSHALIYVLCKKKCQDMSVLTFNALPCLGAGVLLILLGSVAEDPEMARFTQASLLAVFYLGTVAGVFGILCYFALQQRATPFRASLVFLIFPLIALGIERAVDGVTLSPTALWLIPPLLLGIFLCLLPPRTTVRDRTTHAPASQT